MRALSELLVDLAESLSGDRHDGVIVVAVDLDLPVESRIGQEAVLAVSLPRGRLRTGFDGPVGRLRARFTREEILP